MVPPIPDTLITDGYGVAAPASGIVIPAVFVKDFVPLDSVFTVSRKLLLARNCPSLTLTVIVALPVSSVASVTVTVRVAPLPPNTMLFSGTSVGLDELPLNVRLPATVSTSPIVKFNGPVVPFTLIVWFPMPVIVGGVLIALTVSTKVSLVEVVPSLTVTVIVALPV